MERVAGSPELSRLSVLRAWWEKRGHRDISHRSDRKVQFNAARQRTGPILHNRTHMHFPWNITCWGNSVCKAIVRVMNFSLTFYFLREQNYNSHITSNSLTGFALLGSVGYFTSSNILTKVAQILAVVCWITVRKMTEQGKSACGTFDCAERCISWGLRWIKRCQ